MRGQRQAEGRRLALRSRATRGVLIEKTSNIQRQGLGSSVKGGRRSSAAVQKSVLYPSPPATTTPSAVLETDPQETKALWERVLGTKMSTRRGRGALGTKTPARRGRGTLKEAVENVENVEENDAQSTIVSEVVDMDTGIVSKDTKVSTKSPALWRQLVFLSRGIDLVSPKRDLALDHFEAFDPGAEHSSEWVLQRLESEEQSVLLRGGRDFNEKTAGEYAEMERRRLCEEEFATFAKEKFFRRPAYLPIENAKREWSAERMIQLNTVLSTADDSLWLPPPLLSGEKSEGKDFNLRPDCAYWQSLLAFSNAYRDLVNIEAYMVDNRITCPYLTIEFKKTDLKVEQAVNQVIAASALALYNRFRLKERRLNVTKKPWTEKYFNHIRHYAITFSASTADIWLVRLKHPPDMDFSAVSWTGCEAMRIGKCICSSSLAVGDLVDWVNVIHWWGITRHGRYCADDIKATLMAGKPRTAKRVSELFDPDEPAD